MHGESRPKREEASNPFSALAADRASRASISSLSCLYSGTRCGGGDQDGLRLAKLGLWVMGGPFCSRKQIGLGTCIREVEEGPNGSISVLQDRSAGKLVRLRPQG